MKAIILLVALFATSVQAKTTHFDVYETEKMIASTTTPKSVSFFDFKITNATASKTVTYKDCSRTGNRDVRDNRNNCYDISTETVKVAQVIIGYRPYGIADRTGEVHNGKRMEFVTFNVALDELSQDSKNILNSKRGLFSSKKKFRRLANELFDFSVERAGNAKFKVTLLK